MCDRCFHQTLLGQTFERQKNKIVLHIFIEIVKESKCKPITNPGWSLKIVL